MADNMDFTTGSHGMLMVKTKQKQTIATKIIFHFYIVQSLQYHVSLMH